jgi:beta-glucosidase
VSDRVERLLSAMTLPEKIGQLTMINAIEPPDGPAEMERQIRAGLIGSVLNIHGAEPTRALQRLAVEHSRLGVPLIFGLDVLHGHHTIFPIPLAEAGAFDPDLWTRTARASATEAARAGITLTFAPMLDICRDPRWGRIAECPGEDALLGSRYAEAKVQGLQGVNLAEPESIAATAKHLGAYGAVMAGRDYDSVDISDRLMAEVYLPPFNAAVKARVAAVMPSFNDLAGVPMTSHTGILDGLLRRQWGFDGVIVSDYLAVSELMVHGVAEDIAVAAALALKAGVDIDMQDQAYAKGLPIALERGLVAIADIDRAVRRVLALKERLGLIDDPWRRLDAPPLPADTLSEFEQLAREAARRSIVLLTNKNQILPLAREACRIALLGPLADAPQDMFGPWFAAAPMEAVTIVQGLRAALPQAEIRHVPGVSIEGDDECGIAEAIAAAQAMDVVVLSLGETKEISGEAHSRGRIDLPGRQRALAEAVLALRKPTIALLSHGRPLALPWLFERADAVLATWFLGSQAGHAIADVLTGAYNPGGRLAVTWPYDVGQIPIFYARRPTGRPAKPEVYFSSRHIDLPIEPQFPFGHGLSYTRFAITALTAMPAEIAAGDSVTVEVEVANLGQMAGEETVLLFLHDPVASVARPLLELRGFAKVRLVPGEHRTMRFSLGPDDFAFLNQALRPCIEPGHFEILVGPCADPSRLQVTKVRVRPA